MFIQGQASYHHGSHDVVWINLGDLSELNDVKIWEVSLRLKGADWHESCDMYASTSAIKWEFLILQQFMLDE